MKLRHGIGLPTTCDYQHCGEKWFNVRAVLAQSYFALPVLHNILHHLFHGNLPFYLFDYFVSGNNKYNKLWLW